MIPVSTEVYYKDNPIDSSLADVFESWRFTHEGTTLVGQQMLPLDAKHLGSHILSVVGFTDYGNGLEVPVGYNAITYEHDDNFFEVGGLIVDPAMIGMGVAKQVKLTLMNAVKEFMPESTLITFANQNSVSINHKFGFTVADIDAVPDSALEICRTECTKFSELNNPISCGPIKCCDTIMVCDMSKWGSESLDLGF